MADNGFRPRASSAPAGACPRAGAYGGAFDVLGAVPRPAEAPVPGLLGVARKPLGESVDDFGQVPLSGRTVWNHVRRGPHPERPATHRLAPDRHAVEAPGSVAATAPKDIARLIHDVAAEQVEIRTREKLVSHLLAGILQPLDSRGDAMSGRDFMALASMAVRAAVECQAAPPRGFDPAGVVSEIAVERLKVVISRLSGHLMRCRGDAPEFERQEVAALVRGALTENDGTNLDRVQQARNLAALLQAFLPARPLSDEMRRSIRMSLTQQTVDGNSLERFEYLSKVLAPRLELLGIKALAPEYEYWDALLPSAPASQLGLFGQRLAGTVAGMPASRVRALVGAWVRQSQAVGCASLGRERARDPVAALDFLMGAVAKDCGATRIAALVQGWLEALPSTAISAARTRLAPLLGDPGRTGILHMSDEQYRAREVFGPRRILVLAALEMSTRPVASDALETDRWALDAGFTSPGALRDKEVFNKAIDRFLQAPSRPPRDLSWAVLVEACAGREDDLSPRTAAAVLEAITPWCAVNPSRASKWPRLRQQLRAAAASPAHLDGTPPEHGMRDTKHVGFHDPTSPAPPEPVVLDTKHGRSHDLTPSSARSPVATGTRRKFIPGGDVIVVESVETPHGALQWRPLSSPWQAPQAAGMSPVAGDLEGALSPQALAHPAPGRGRPQAPGSGPAPGHAPYDGRRGQQLAFDRAVDSPQERRHKTIQVPRRTPASVSRSADQKLSGPSAGPVTAELTASPSPAATPVRSRTIRVPARTRRQAGS